MSHFPYTILSSAISVDGCLNDATDERLLLSHPKDFERVDVVRASCDGILVGAHTLRTDNPSLKIRSTELINQRIRAKKPRNPARITVTTSGNLPSSHAFFEDSDNAILIYAPDEVADKLQEDLAHTSAVVIPLGHHCVDLSSLLIDLKKRGIHQLLIEGGETIATGFLTAGLVNELQIAVAPFFVGEPDVPRLVTTGVFPHDKNNRMHLLNTKMVGDMAVLTYKLQTLDNESDT